MDDSITRSIQEQTLTAHKALGLTGYSRGDFIMAQDGTIYLLEVNTLPGMTPTSLLPRAAKHIGLSFADLIEELIRLGIEARGN